MENKNFPQLCNDRECTGCMACVNACPKQALKIVKNAEGFYRPQLEDSLCIMCGLCEKSCPILTPPMRNKMENIKVYAAWHLDDDIRLRSSSGGAFTALAEVILNKGGIVVGAAYTDDMQIEHIAISNIKDLHRLRLSKYAQSNIGRIFNDIRNYLKNNKQVLFVGTPCQAAGLKGFLRKDYTNLICADLICHGVPSNSILQSYLKWLEPKTGKVCGINFRDKQKGWYDNLRITTNTEGKQKALIGNNDAYWVAFNRNSCLQESCYHCTSQGFPRCSDITFADFWRIGHNIPFGHKDEIEKGVSMIIVNNPQAQWTVDEASRNMFIEERTLEEAIEGNQAAVKSSTRPKTRDLFYKDLASMPFEQFRQKYMKPNFKEQLSKIFRERLPFWLIKPIRLNKQK